MSHGVFSKALGDLRGAILGWGLGLGALTALIVALYPSIRDNPDLQAYWETLPEAMRTLLGGVEQLTSVSGYFASQLFAFLPLLLAVFTVGRVVNLTIGEESEGRMELVLAQPVRRWRLATHRFAALALATGLICAVIALTIALGGPFVGLAADEILALVGWSLLAVLPALAFAGLALAVAGFTHQRSPAIAAGATLAVASYMIDGLAPLNEHLEPLQKASPYHWYSMQDPITGPVSLAAIAGLLVLIVGLAGLGAWGYEQKDVGV